jgi:hypothetical protein
MADIDVVPKQRSNWIWIVLAIVAAILIIWAVATRSPQTTSELYQDQPGLLSLVQVEGLG